MAEAIPATVIDAQLDAFARRFPDDVEALAAMRSLLASAAAPCSRAHFSPGHFTASAGVLSPSGNHVLLVHHARLDRWLQPGGHIEAGDATLLDAARREVLEECGLATGEPVGGIAAPVDLDVHAIPERPGEPGHLHFDVRFGFVADPATSLVRSEESHAVRWFRIEEIDALGVDASARRLIERCRRAL
jgi:8-oxo-dGTP pyrophosphatase MutT (NUDIX family)